MKSPKHPNGALKRKFSGHIHGAVALAVRVVQSGLRYQGDSQSYRVEEMALKMADGSVWLLTVPCIVPEGQPAATLRSVAWSFRRSLQAKRERLLWRQVSPA